MNLYEINAEILKLMESVDENGEMPMSVFSALSDLAVVESEKLESLGLIIKNLAAESDAIKREIDTFTDRKKTLDNKINGIKEYVTGYLLGWEKRKFETARVVLSIRPSVAVVLDDEKLIPEKYLIPQEPKISKTLIKEDLVLGVTVPGAVLEHRNNLQVR